MSTFDDPNREAVGLDPIWTDAENPPLPEGDDELDEMTKDQLLDYAAANGVEVSDRWTKAEIREAIDGN